MIVQRAEELLPGPLELAVPGRCASVRQGEAGSQDPAPRLGVEQCHTQSVPSDLVALCAGHPLDEAVETQAPQIVGHLPGAKVVGIEAQQLRNERPECPVPEPLGQQSEETQRLQESHHPGVAEAKGGSPLAENDVGPTQRLEGRAPEDAILAQLLDVQETSIGPETNLPKGRQISKPFADPEVARLVDGGLRSQPTAFLVVLLDLGVLVVNVQRRPHPFGQDPRPEAARRSFGNAAPKDQLHAVGFSRITSSKNWRP